METSSPNPFGKWLLNLSLFFCFFTYGFAFFTNNLENQVLEASALPEEPYESWESNLAEDVEESTLDRSLELQDSESERLVSMTGKLILRVSNSDTDIKSIEDGGHPIYCWIVELDQESFEIACSTPVRAAFQTPASIRSFGNELQLTGGFDEEWLCEHLNQTVTVQGYLWHAHTCHHHTLVMLDANPWYKE